MDPCCAFEDFHVVVWVEAICPWRICLSVALVSILHFTRPLRRRLADLAHLYHCQYRHPANFYLCADQVTVDRPLSTHPQFILITHHTPNLLSSITASRNFISNASNSPTTHYHLQCHLPNWCCITSSLPLFSRFSISLVVVCLTLPNPFLFPTIPNSYKPTQRPPLLP